MTEAPKILLAHHLKTLKLPTFLREYEKLARPAAEAARLVVCALSRAGRRRGAGSCPVSGAPGRTRADRRRSPQAYDLRAFARWRERRMVERRIKAAKFPATKSLDSFDFKAIPKLNKMQVLELARCEWTLRRENVIMPEACRRHDALGHRAGGTSST